MSLSSNPNAIAMYMTGNVTQSDPAQIIVLLYEGAIYRIGQAIQETDKQNTLSSGIAIYRALAIIGELRKSLNLEEGGVIARNLDRLYLHMHEELVKGHLARKPEPLERVRTLLTDLNSSWRQVAVQVKTLSDAGTGAPPLPAMPAGLSAYAQPDTTPRLALKA
ncbi:MAG: flagellar export chaperone FliS [Nitrospirota bacterium]|nr:flagellar export chaperone FliS [Nitrospirota bacterium]MDP2383786.1 flagellar export chaperone FliS [Nitrospirota bacterium]MDP3598201.1 flagellar export chaperone FliS [Nitrospirota bacterium]